MQKRMEKIKEVVATLLRLAHFSLPLSLSAPNLLQTGVSPRETQGNPNQICIMGLFRSLLLAFSAVCSTLHTAEDCLTARRP